MSVRTNNLSAVAADHRKQDYRKQNIKIPILVQSTSEHSRSQGNSAEMTPSGSGMAVTAPGYDTPSSKERYVQIT